MEPTALDGDSVRFKLVSGGIYAVSGRYENGSIEVGQVEPYVSIQLPVQLVGEKILYTRNELIVNSGIEIAKKRNLTSHV